MKFKIHEVAPYVISYFETGSEEDVHTGLITGPGGGVSAFRTKESAEKVRDKLNEDYPEYTHEVCKVVLEKPSCH